MYLYFAEHQVENSPIKIGMSKDVDARMNQLSTSSPWGVHCFYHIHFATEGMAAQAEKLLHRFHSEKRMNGEWFESHVDLVEAHDLIIRLYGDSIDDCARPECRAVLYSAAAKHMHDYEERNIRIGEEMMQATMKKRATEAS